MWSKGSSWPIRLQVGVTVTVMAMADLTEQSLFNALLWASAIQASFVAGHGIAGPWVLATRFPSLSM